MKVPFNADVYPGTELTQNLPKNGNGISRIRVVLTDITNDTLEEIIQEAEIIGIEKLYGEFLRVENDSIIPIEKQATRQVLLSGPVFVDLPFYCIKNTYFDSILLRILFSPGSQTKFNGHFLIDYVASDSIPTNMYFQRTRQISFIKTPIRNASRLTLDVNLPGPVYEMYFTVRDANKNFVNLIDNVTLLVDDRERFNLSGQYLQYIEPLKKHGGKYASNIYYYSFALNPEDYKLPSGQTYLSINQRFVFDFMPILNSTYTLTLWSCSHNLVYNNKKVFDDGELLLGYSQSIVSTLPQVKVKTSLLNTLYTNTISFFSENDLGRDSNQIYTSIDPLNQNSTLQVTYSSPGFSNTVCKYNLIGIKKYNLPVSQLYDSFIPNESDYAIIDNNAIVHSLYTIGITANTFYVDSYKRYVLYDSQNGVCTKPGIFTIQNVTGEPSSYFDTDIIPRTGGFLVNTTNLVSTLNTIIASAIDATYIYVLDTTGTLTQYNVSTLTIVKSVTRTSVAKGSIVLNSIGPLVLYRGVGIIQYNRELVVQYQVLTALATYVFGDDFDNMYYINQNQKIFRHDRNGLAQWCIQITGMGNIRASIGNNVLLVTLGSTGNVFTVVDSTGSTVHVKNVPVGYTEYLCFDTLGVLITPEYSSSAVDYTSYFNKIKYPYEIPKYAGEYFSDPSTPNGFTLVPFKYWNVFLYTFYSGQSKKAKISVSSNVYVSVLTYDKTESIYNAHGKSPVSIQQTYGASASIITCDRTTSDVLWVALVDGLGSEYAYGSYYANSNVYLHGNFGVLSANIYNSDKTVFATIPPQTTLGGYCVQYSTSGFARWYVYCSCTTCTSEISSIVTDNSGNVYIVITVKYSPVDDTLNLYSSSGAIQASYSINANASMTLVASYTGSGTFINSAVICFVQSGLSNRFIQYSSGLLYIQIFEYGIYTIDTALTTEPDLVYPGVNCGLTRDRYILFDTYTGNTPSITDILGNYLIYADGFGFAGFNNAVTLNGYIIAACVLSGSGTLNTVSNTLPFDTTINNEAGVIVKFNQTNTLQILCTISSPSNGRNDMYDISSDSDNNLYITGIYSGNGSIVRDSRGSYYRTFSTNDPSVSVSFTVKMDLNGNIAQIT
jgi:hypothetical protein